MTTEEKITLIEKHKGISLKDVRPDLAAEWHPTKNGDLTPEMVSVKSTTKVWWLLPYDDENTGKHFDFEWDASIYQRVKGTNCPYMAGCKVWIGYNDLLTVYPHLSKIWHPTKNKDLTPSMITSGSSRMVWWLCDHGHEWQATVLNKTRSAGCPYCTNKKLLKGFNDLSTTDPHVATEWNYAKNNGLTPDLFTRASTARVWWKCANGHEWELSIRAKVNRGACPCCRDSVKNAKARKKKLAIHDLGKDLFFA